MRRLTSGIAVLLFGLQTPAMSANYVIDNPAERIINPAGKMYNPASQIINPASNIYNPAAQMDNTSPLSPVNQPNPQSPATKEVAETITADQIKKPPSFRGNPAIPHKNYHYKTARAYVDAAKKAFSRDDYVGFLSITDDALRRIRAGTLTASKIIEKKLVLYMKFGYGLLDKSGE